METARFLLTISRRTEPECRTSIEVRRSEQSRAVLHAQKWLLKTQRLQAYFGITYDMYEIYKQNPLGEWVRVDCGDVTDAETRRTEARAARAQASQSDVPKDARRVEKGATRGKRSKRVRAELDSWITSGIAPRQRSRAAASPLKRRIEEAKAEARRIIAERKASEES